MACQCLISLSSSLHNFEFHYIKQIWYVISVDGYYLKRESFKDIKQIWYVISVDGYYLKRESFKDLLSLAEKHSMIVVRGPKGVSKSSSLVGNVKPQVCEAIHVPYKGGASNI